MITTTMTIKMMKQCEHTTSVSCAQLPAVSTVSNTYHPSGCSGDVMLLHADRTCSHSGHKRSEDSHSCRKYQQLSPSLRARVSGGENIGTQRGVGTPEPVSLKRKHKQARVLGRNLQRREKKDFAWFDAPYIMHHHHRHHHHNISFSSSFSFSSSSPPPSSPSPSTHQTHQVRESSWLHRVV